MLDIDMNHVDIPLDLETNIKFQNKLVVNMVNWKKLVHAAYRYLLRFLPAD